jgi:hypothetical protein
VAERLLDVVQLGFTAMNFIPAGPGKAEQRERLAREVIPAVRAGARPPLRRAAVNKDRPTTPQRHGLTDAPRS